MTEKSTHSQMEKRLNRLESEIKELRTLYDAATNIGISLTLKDTIESIVISIISALNAGGCAVSKWHRNLNQLETLFDLDNDFPDKVDSIGQIYHLKDYPETVSSLETGKTLLIQADDPNADKAETALMKEQGVLTNLAVPMKTKDRVLGLLEIYECLEPREFSKQEIRLAESLAHRAAIALENAQLYEESQQEIARRRKAEKRLGELVSELEGALSEVKTLKGFIPICSSCKKVRDDGGFWNQVEAYIRKHSEAEFSHSICPDCAKKHYPDLKIYSE